MLSEDLAAALNPFWLPAPVLEWISLVERREPGQGLLARLLFSLEAFIEKVSPDLRREAAAGEGQGAEWWPVVHDAAQIVHLGRKLGLTDTRSKMPTYSGRFSPDVLSRLLGQIRDESDHDSLRRAAAHALAIAPA